MKKHFSILPAVLCVLSIVGMIPHRQVEPLSFEPARVNDSVIHPVINITSNAELVSFPNKTGLGIPGDPFVIRDLTIEGNGKTCIFIQNTFSYLRIENCTFLGSDEVETAGIELVNASNIEIVESRFQFNYYGLKVQLHSNSITISNSTIRDSLQSNIFLNESHAILLIGNNARNSPVGAYIRKSQHIELYGNNFSENNVSHVSFQESTENEVDGNYFSGSTQEAIEILGSTNNSFYRNYIGDSGQIGVHLHDGCTNNTFYLNTFENNSYSHVVVDNPVDLNHWDKDAYGNYWDDYLVRYPAGIMQGYEWDVAYSINGSSIDVDNHPLGIPLGTTHHLVAIFTASTTGARVGEAIQFTYSGINSSTIAGFTWDFGDGRTSTARDPVHAYDSGGTFTVSLVVEDVVGSTDQEVMIGLITIIVPGAIGPVARAFILVLIPAITVAASVIVVYNNVVFGWKKSRSASPRPASLRPASARVRSSSKKNKMTRMLDVSKLPSAPLVQEPLPLPESLKESGGGDEWSSVDLSRRVQNAREMEGEVELHAITPYCLIHKTPVKGLSYTCEHCHATYCLKCAIHLVEQDEPCWNCNIPIKGLGGGGFPFSKPLLEGGEWGILEDHVIQKVNDLEADGFIDAEIIDEVLGRLSFIPTDRQVPYLEGIFCEGGSGNVRDDGELGDLTMLGDRVRDSLVELEASGLINDEIMPEVLLRLSIIPTEQEQLQYLADVFTPEVGDDEWNYKQEQEQEQETNEDGGFIAVFSTEVRNMLNQLIKEGYIDEEILDEIIEKLTYLESEERAVFLREFFIDEQEQGDE
ncbi:MAG: NosD domain-containing protein [Promethearchaeota archaeon]